MRLPFTKMHGLGNDFVVLDGRAEPIPALTGEIVRRLANRREGIGCDQLIVLEPSDTADIRMRIYNSDGGEVESCGNASRAVALLLGEAASVETAGGQIRVSPERGGASVDMGIPRFDWEAIPLAYAMDTLAMPVGWDGLEQPSAVNVGNPHVVFFVPDSGAVPLGQIGPEIETDPLFPEKINVNVATIVDQQTIKLRVWERGAGLTKACGTGACASVVTAHRAGLVDRKADVVVDGGVLSIDWNDKDDRVRMTGPVELERVGEWSRT